MGQGWYAITSEDVGDGLVTDLQPQFAQFSLDLAVPPRIGTGKLQHQALHFDVGSWSSTVYSMSVGPFPPNQFTMPFKDGFGLEDADHLAQLLQVLPTDAFQPNVKKHKGEFLGTGYSHRLVQLPLDNLELSAQE